MGNLGLNIATATAKGFTHQVLGQGLITDTEVTNENGHITIDAREGDDQIKVNQNGKILTVYVSSSEMQNHVQTNHTVTIDTSKAKSVTIFGGKGQDKIEVDKKVTFPLTLKGNEHNDDIRATNPGHNDIYGGGGIDKIQAKPTDHVTYGDFLRVVQGQGTICIPTASAAELPPPPPPTPCPVSQPPPICAAAPALTPEEIQQQWNQVVQQSLQQSNVAQSRHDVQCANKKIQDLEKVLEAALASGNIDLAMLLISGLETRQANEVAGKLLGKIREFQNERKQVADQIGKLGKEEGNKATDLNIRAGDIGTEIQMLQTFLQDVMSQKAEAQNLASNFLKSRHDAAMGIIRNIG